MKEKALRLDDLEEVRLAFGDVEVRLLKVVDLEAHIDAAELLSAGDAAEPPYWMHVWPGAMALGRRLIECGIDGERLFEVGCGLGLPALVAAQLGARVVASDWHREPLAWLARSAARNRCRVERVQMDWRHRAVAEGSFDLVVGADVAYDRDEQGALAALLSTSVRSGGRMLLADSVNTYRAGFVECLQQAGFEVEEHKVVEREEGRVVWVRLLEGYKR